MTAASTRYVAQSADAVYVIPRPRSMGAFFARSVDPAGSNLVSAVLLRAGLVYLMFPDPARPGGYVLDRAPGGSATSPYATPATVNGAAHGVPEGVFLSEFNAKWRKYAFSVGINPDSTENGPVSAGGPVWVVPNGSPSTPDVHLTNLATAAKAWGWQRLVTA